ncbi:MAG TPA: hypothetical protein VFI45_10610 [Candidatus Acidoferrum sp.]|nr:hypothetical protein [Candidatus Acidoferrum sp.]
MKRISSVTDRFSALLPSAWMLLVLLTFLVIRVLGSHLFHSLHLFGKAL